ncbi:glycosyltransferase family 2 protein [Candidatus Woesearchaeota archaeon]|nr:glycosyltransferase family 2 protein [Candidatus Woesearchaeota archaeon]
MRILLGCPTSNHKAYCIDEYIEGLKKLTYSDFDIMIVDNSETEDYFNILKEKLKIINRHIILRKIPYTGKARDRIVKARNMIRKKALEDNYDYFFSLEQDIIPPEDIIESMLRHNKKIISGVYYKEYNVTNAPGITLIKPLLYAIVKGSSVRQYDEEEVENDKLIQVGACGVGCILIHRDILKEIEFRYEPDKVVFDDMFFCKDCYQKGFNIYADCSLKCKHLVKGMDWKKIEK